MYNLTFSKNLHRLQNIEENKLMFQEEYVECPNKNRAIRLYPKSLRSGFIEVIDLNSKKVLHTREENGIHICPTFTEDTNIVIYATIDFNWYCPPIINLWHLEENIIEEIITSHNPQSFLLLANSPKSNKLIIGTVDGSISAYNMLLKKVIWHFENPIWEHSDRILSLSISECGEKVAILQKYMLSVYDFTTGNKFFSTPFMEEYESCEFAENDTFIRVIHAEKATVNINCKQFNHNSLA